MFALESLALVGETYATSERVRKACHFLLSHQKEDGGWGESYEVCRHPSQQMRFSCDHSRLGQACAREEWVDHPEKTQVVMTSWAAMALMYAEYPEPGPIERAVGLVMSRQLPVSLRNSCCNL